MDFFSILFYGAPVAFLVSLTVIAAIVRTNQLQWREIGQLEDALLSVQAERDEATQALVDAFHKGWAECDADWKSTDPYQRGWACCEATLQTDKRYQLGFRAGETQGFARARVELIGVVVDSRTAVENGELAQ